MKLMAQPKTIMKAYRTESGKVFRETSTFRRHGIDPSELSEIQRRNVEQLRKLLPTIDVSGGTGAISFTPEKEGIYVLNPVT